VAVRQPLEVAGSRDRDKYGRTALMNSTFSSGLSFGLVISTLLACYVMVKRSILGVVMLSFFILCLILVLTNYVWDYLPAGKLIYDSAIYHQTAGQISSHLSQKFWANLIADYGMVDTSAYTLPLGVLYYLFGPSEIVGRLLSVLASVGIIWNLYNLALRLFNRRVATLTIIMLMFCPYLWYLSIRLIRDTIIIFLITLFFRMLAEIKFNRSLTTKIGQYFIGIAAIFYLGCLRPPLLLILMLTFITFIVATTSIRTKFKIIVFLTIVSCSSIGILFYAKIYSDSVLVDSLSYMKLQTINEGISYDKEHADSFYKGNIKYNNITDIFKNMVPSIFYFLYSPLPWTINKARQLLGLIDSFQIMILTYFFAKGFKVLYKRSQEFALSLLVFLLVGITVGSILVQTAGAAMRYRTMFTFVIFPVAAYALLTLWQKVRVTSLLVDQTSEKTIADVHSIKQD
jgi:hypothetical protein